MKSFKAVMRKDSITNKLAPVSSSFVNLNKDNAHSKNLPKNPRIITCLFYLKLMLREDMFLDYEKLVKETDKNVLKEALKISFENFGFEPNPQLREAMLHNIKTFKSKILLLKGFKELKKC